MSSRASWQSVGLKFRSKIEINRTQLQRPSDCHPPRPFSARCRIRSGGSVRSLTDRTGQRTGRNASSDNRSFAIFCSGADRDESVPFRIRRTAVQVGEATRIAPPSQANIQTITDSNVSSAVNNTMTPVITVEVTRLGRDPSIDYPKRLANSLHRRLSLWF